MNTQIIKLPMMKLFNFFTRIFKKSPKKAAKVFSTRFDNEHDGWLGI